MTYFGDITMGKMKINVTAQRGNASCVERSGCISSQGSASLRMGTLLFGFIFRLWLGPLPKRARD